MECGYCGQKWESRNGFCAHCGAPEKRAIIEKRDPFFVNDFIVYSIRDYCRMCTEFIFYKGITFFGKVVITDYEAEQWEPTFDPTDLILERLNK